MGQGYQVVTVATGRAALDQLAAGNINLVVLDLMLPDTNGAAICQEVRGWGSEVSIIILSAQDQEREKIAALDSGADDYMTKPFSSGELLARVRTLLRRTDRTTSSAASIVEVGDLSLDLAYHSLTVAGHAVHLTPKEYALLAYLVQHAGRVVTHHQLLSAVWGAEYTESSSYLHVYVRQLRQKIEADPANPRHIRNESGVGYRFMLEPQSDV